MVSGSPPVRAKKLRYYADRNFTSRVLPPPTLSGDTFADRPRARPDDWSSLPPIRDTIGGEAARHDEDDGGVHRAPDFAEGAPRPAPPTDIALLDEEGDEEDIAGTAFAQAARLAALDPDDGIAL